MNGGPDLYSFRELWRQYRNCRRNKRNTINALAFEIDAEAGLISLQQELRDHTYRPGPSICFVTDGPKPREVFAADFRDRVVHHLLVSRLERVFEPRFIHDSYACRNGKGVLAASDRLMSFLRRATANGQRPALALKLDVASFFPSIHKQTLFEIICRQVHDPELRWLSETILFHDPTGSYRFKQGPAGVPPPGSRRYPIPEQKSLFGKAGEYGLPIGNLTSQFWANVYLNELDHFVKRTLGCRHYLRYVDDLVLLAGDPAMLLAWREQIRAFARARLLLALRPDGNEPFPVHEGVTFVGWKTWWSHRVPRRQTLRNLDARLANLERQLVLRPVSNGAACRIGMRQPARPTVKGWAPPLRKLQSTVASYSGHLRHGASHRAWEGLWRARGWLDSIFVRTGWAVGLRWPMRAIGGRRFSVQYGRLIRRAGDRTLVFCQVGRFVEFYGPQRESAARVLRLVRVNIGRGGYAFSVGFPVRLRAEYVSRAVRTGWIVADVREVGRIGSGCGDRAVVAVWFPTAHDGHVAPHGRGAA